MLDPGQAKSPGSLQRMPTSHLRRRARSLYDSGDTNQSLLMHLELTSRSTATKEDFYVLGKCWVFSNSPGCLDRSIEAYSRALEMDPKFCMAFLQRGHAYSRKMMPAKAVEEYDRLLELQPKNSAALDCRGCELSRLGNFEDAFDSIARAVEVNPKYVNGLAGKGVLHCYQGRRDLAEACFDEGLRIAESWNDSRLTLYLSFRSLVFLHWGEYDLAESDQNRVLGVVDGRKDNLARSVHLWRRAFARMHISGQELLAKDDIVLSFKLAQELSVDQFPLIEQFCAPFPHLSTEFDEYAGLFRNTPVHPELMRILSCYTQDRPSQRVGFLVEGLHRFSTSRVFLRSQTETVMDFFLSLCL